MTTCRSQFSLSIVRILLPLLGLGRKTGLDGKLLPMKTLSLVNLLLFTNSDIVEKCKHVCLFLTKNTHNSCIAIPSCNKIKAKPITSKQTRPHKIKTRDSLRDCLGTMSRPCHHGSLLGQLVGSPVIRDFLRSFLCLELGLCVCAGLVFNPQADTAPTTSLTGTSCLF